MKGDKVYCVVTREKDYEEGSYDLFIKPEPNKYFPVAMLDLVHEEIYENLDQCAEEGSTEIVLVESGEQEDVHWNPYYKTESAKIIEPEVTP